MWREIRKIFHAVVNLRETTDTRGTIDSIRHSTAIQGYNIWILACGAMLASIGLDLNSVAVIIGAMLISPLMSPILGIGLAFGINDREHLFRALESFAIAVMASLGVSALYFFLSPFDGAPGLEITSRTTPTILDVFIALFGGTAGIVAASRKEKTNAIPGVAIATALMPPICTAGYGLANMDWGIFFGALYLFFINAVFIALSTYLIIRYLRFPYAEYPDESTRRKALGWIFIFATALITPSVFFFYNVLNKGQMVQNIQEFVEEEINKEEIHRVSNTDIIWKKNLEWGKEKDSTKVTLYIAGEPLSKKRIAELDSLKDLPKYGMDKIIVKYLQVQLSAEELTDQSTKNAIKALDPKIDLLRLKFDSLQNVMLAMEENKALDYPEIHEQAKRIYPDLMNLTISESAFSSGMDSLKTDTLSIALTQWKRGLRSQNIQANNSSLKSWLERVLNVDSVRVISVR
ncbi:MAG: DUF389 domain-containing protein [Bacteroidia bacterium]|nr:DUF389 domain-containing protein [Bacteroidia bacterium]